MSSDITGSVGSRQLSWKSVPKGHTGQAHVDVGSGQVIEVRWRKDSTGLWLETPLGVFGFDLMAEITDDGKVAYRVSQRGTANQWDGLSFLRAGEEAVAAGAAGKKKGTRVRAQMPGKVLRVSVKPGAMVEKDQPLIVMEAMKMENEIRAPQAGKVTDVKVAEGQAVETGADLCVIEAT